MTHGPAPTMVVFDLGGVVVRLCRSWEEACARAGLPYRAAVMAPDLVAARKALREEHECGRLECGAFFAGLASLAPGLYTPAEYQRLHDAWILEEYPGVGALVDDLHAAGVATGVLSNTNHSHWAQLVAADRYPTPRRVRHPHASHLLGLAKPSAGIYRRFAELAAAPPAAIVFFDDLPDNIAGARAAGWRAERIDPTGDTAAQMRGHLRALGTL